MSQKATKAKKEETLINKEEFFRSLDEAEKQYWQGKCKTFDNLNDMNIWLKSL